MTRREWIVSAVRRLAMPADEQVRYLASKGLAPKRR